MKSNPITDRVISLSSKAHINLNLDELLDAAVKNNEGTITDKGALAADTGKYTGRSPKDKFTVSDEKTENTVWWGDINQRYNG